jgi:hypothetical protein
LFTLYKEDTNPFSGTEIFGKNYQTALTDPKNQQQHEQAVNAQNPAKLEFQGTVKCYESIKGNYELHHWIGS